ncbi:MAG TPA: Tol-Pal system beta propeller repeat protein TolB [Caulobacteraceae bacterium]|jgi:TolB protein|nr:Tol-Pal system beta propeller repeat protein TolB [Caulobacteraceae bacterium]
MRLRRLLAAMFALVMVASLASAPARAQVEVDVNKGVVTPLPIAVPGFSGTETRSAGIGADIAKVVSADLERSGFFRPLDPNGFIERNLDVAVQPRFQDWRVVNAQALVNGAAAIGADGRLQVDFRVWDVFNEKQILGLQFVSTPENWRRVAHKISDAVYKQLTGEDGYFDTRIVFVAESGPKTNRIKQLEIMDQDGANPSYLTPTTYQAMTPRFSATDQEITYMALRADSARIYLFNIETARQETLGQFSGIVFAPRFSPDGGKVAFSVERNGNTDIYVMDLKTRASTRITSDPAIDTSPSFSPDGTKLAFNSDRGGGPQLYVMNVDGSGVHRISYAAGRYTTPVWSPKGDFIAFTKQTGGEFHIGVMRPDGSDERILTTSYLDEGPTWAPNGRVLMFSRETRGGGSRLWSVDISGRNLRAAPYAGAASDPAWSPLLK